MQPFTASDGVTYYRYPDYLASELWASVKRHYYQHRPAVCCICRDKSRPVELHHLTYANIGREHIDDLAPLCREHHAAEHKYGGLEKAIKAEKKAKKKQKHADNVSRGLKRFHKQAKQLLALLIQIYPALICNTARKHGQRKELAPRLPPGTIVRRQRAATSPAAQ